MSGKLTKNKWQRNGKIDPTDIYGTPDAGERQRIKLDKEAHAEAIDAADAPLPLKPGQAEWHYRLMQRVKKKKKG